MQVFINKRSVKVKSKVSIGGRQFYGNTLFNQPFLLMTILNNIGNRTDFKMMFFGKLFKFREFCHVPIFCHNFTDNCSGLESCNARKVYRPFCVSSSYKHSPPLRLKRKDMSGPD